MLIGDSILDVYTYGNIVGIALDAPVPEIEERKSKVFFGGNGLVAKNILELGGELTFISVLGADDDAKYYDSFIHPKLKKIFLVDDTRKTTVKRRWFGNGKKLLQVNKVDNHPISANLEKKIIRAVENTIKKIDVIAVMDPQHGLLTGSLIKRIVTLSNKYKKPLYIDSQISHRKSNHHLYKGADTMFLNQKEAKAVYPHFRNSKHSLLAIKKKLKLKNVVVKLGDQGSIALFGGQNIRTKPYKVKSVDVCGAGDAFLAAMSLGDRDRPAESLKLANIWAGLSTAVHGTRPPRKQDIMRIIKNGQVKN